jgi:hypothetical protein
MIQCPSCCWRRGRFRCLSNAYKFDLAWQETLTFLQIEGRPGRQKCGSCYSVLQIHLSLACCVWNYEVCFLAATLMNYSNTICAVHVMFLFVSMYLYMKIKITRFIYFLPHLMILSITQTNGRDDFRIMIWKCYGRKQYRPKFMVLSRYLHEDKRITIARIASLQAVIWTRVPRVRRRGYNHGPDFLS